MIKENLFTKILNILKLLLLNTFIIILIITFFKSNTIIATINEDTETDEEVQIIEEDLSEENLEQEADITEIEEPVEEEIKSEPVVETTTVETPKPVETIATTSRSQEEARVEQPTVVETPKSYKLNFSSGSVDRSCYQQSGYLNSNNLCIWAGKGNVNDGQASYFCAHDFTSWGRAINSLYSGDLVLIDGVEYRVINSTLVARHGDHGAYATNAIYDCFEYNGDRAYFQTCVNDSQMVIKECIPNN